MDKQNKSITDEAVTRRCHLLLGADNLNFTILDVCAYAIV